MPHGCILLNTLLGVSRAPRNVHRIVPRDSTSIMGVARRVLLGRIAELMRAAVVPARRTHSPTLLLVHARHVLQARRRRRYVSASGSVWRFAI
jgi:hypothetical protein